MPYCRRMEIPSLAVLTTLLAAQGYEATVQSVVPLSGGASRLTCSVEARRADGTPWNLIFQRHQGVEWRWPNGLADEAKVSDAGRRAGMSVPKVLATNTSPGGDAVGGTFQLCEAVPGETIARRILRDPEYVQVRNRIAFDAGVELAKLHSVEVAALPFLETTDELARYREIVDELAIVSPAFELAFRWLELHRPQNPRSVVVHGDFRLGNLIISPTGISAVIDWELAHLSDPHEDLGWLCVKAWRFGGGQPVAGVGAYDDLIAGYESASAHPVDRDALWWWEMLGTVKWGVMCRTQYERHRSGDHRSVEMPAIGRRVAEQEYDLVGKLAGLGGRP